MKPSTINFITQENVYVEFHRAAAPSRSRANAALWQNKAGEVNPTIEKTKNKRMKRTSTHPHSVADHFDRSMSLPEKSVKLETKGSAALRFITGQVSRAFVKKLLLALFCTGLACWAFAQDTAGVAAGREPTGLRAYEKVYVVVAVLTTILAGFFIYVIRLDRKISKLEKE